MKPINIDRSCASGGPKCATKKESRRATLKKMLAGGGAAAAAGALPVKWTRPVVDALVLPAHAAASGATHFHGTVVLSESESLKIELCIDVPNGGALGDPFAARAKVKAYDTPTPELRAYLEASGKVSGAREELTAQSGCVYNIIVLYIKVTGISATEASFTLTDNVSDEILKSTIPAGSGCPAKQCN